MLSAWPIHCRAPPLADNLQPSLPPSRVVALLCLAEILSMTGYSTYPALLPVLREAWGLSFSEAGLISGAFFGGYMAAVPVLMSLTDRVDARRVYAFSTGLSGIGALGFGVFANGLWSALVFQALAGAGLAGTYMPGLKALSDHIEGGRQSRYVAFYTSTFTIGASASLLAAGLIEPAAGWRWAFGLAAAGPALAGMLVIRGLPARRPLVERTRALLDFRPVFRNRAALGFILGYAAHCWELFGSRSWIVAFFVFFNAIHLAAEAMPLSPVTLAALVNLLGLVASISGNEIAVRYGRQRVILVIMLTSASLGCMVGFSAPLPWFVVLSVASVYTFATMADSAALTAGVIGAAVPTQRGATMAVHSLFGFGAAFIAPVVFGLILDLAGGNTSVSAWGLAFASLGIGCGLGPLAFALYSYQQRSKPQ